MMIGVAARRCRQLILLAMFRKVVQMFRKNVFKNQFVTSVLRKHHVNKISNFFDSLQPSSFRLLQPTALQYHHPLCSPMSARSHPRNPIKLTMEFTTKPHLDLRHAPYFLADTNNMPKLEKPQSSLASSPDLISANRPIQRRKRKRRTPKQTTTENKSSSTSSTSSQRVCRSDNGKSQTTKSTPNPHPDPSKSSPSLRKHSAPKLRPNMRSIPRAKRSESAQKCKTSHVSNKVAHSKRANSNSSQHLLAPEQQNRYTMLFSDSEDEVQCDIPTKSTSRPPPPDCRATKRRKIAHSNVSNSAGKYVATQCHRTAPYRRKKSLFRSNKSSVEPSPSIDSTASSVSVLSSNSNVMESNSQKTRTLNDSEPRRTPLNRIQRSQSTKCNESTNTKMLNGNSRSSKCSVKKKNINTQRQPPRRHSARMSGKSTRNPKRDPFLESVSRLRKDRNAVKKKYKVTYIDDPDLIPIIADHKHKKKRKDKSPGDMINGIHVHEYQARTISKRTRKARRIQEHYNQQIQREYEHLEKDTFIRDGKSVEVVCLE